MKVGEGEGNGEGREQERGEVGRKGGGIMGQRRYKRAVSDRPGGMAMRARPARPVRRLCGCTSTQPDSSRPAR